MTDDDERFTMGLASHGLRDDDGHPCALEALGAERAIAAASRANLLGLLGGLVATGSMWAPEDVRGRVRDATIRRLVADMRIERQCGVVVDRLESEGIQVRVLKGLATAQLDHPDASHRSTSDIDLLVPGVELGRAVALLGRLGYRRDLPERRRQFDGRFGKDVTLFGPPGVPELDLHRTLVKGPFGLALDPDEAFEDGQPLLLAGTVVATAPTLSWRLLHSCLVIGAGDLAPSAGMMRDLALQARDAALDVDEFRALVVRSRSAPVVAEAIRRTSSRMGVELPDLVGGSRGAPVWWLRTYAAHGGNDVSTQVGAVVALGWRHRLPYLLGLAAPSKQYRQARSAAGRTSASQLLLDALRPVFRRRAGRRRRPR